MKRDGACESLWQQTGTLTGFSTALIPGQNYDVLIVGGGITGISTALQLQLAGKKCIVAEAYNICFGTTGGTTAHLNTILDTPYSEIGKNFGSESAAIVLQAATEAIALIRKNIREYAIDCDFEERESYNFSTTEAQDKFLEDMVDTGKELGIDIDYINDSPFPIPYLKIARVMGQAQFNPVKYVAGLAKAFINNGGVIAEECRVTGITAGDDTLTADTTQGEIHASQVIYATHIPPGVNLLHFRCAPYRSYAIAVKLADGKYPQALGYDMDDPYHYYRSQRVNGKEYLIAGGEDHKTGHEENAEQCFRKLEAYVRQWFQVEEVAYKWSSQYYVPNDGLPYIGRLPGGDDKIYVATGFNGNGMIFGTVSASVLTAILQNTENAYTKLFDPSRIKPIAGFSNFVKEGADVVKEFIKGKFSAEKIAELNELAPGEARVINYEDQKIALYRDEMNKVHAVSPVCTHVHCTVSWNNAEKTWDCPCHGARYDHEGVVVTGPAQRDLERIQLGKE